MGGTTIEQPTPPAAPTTAESIDAWVQSMPEVFAEQQRQAPLQAQQQVELAQQYAEPLGQAMKSAQEAMYPETSALQEQLAGQASTGMEAGMPDWMKEQYRDVYASNLGTNVGSGIGADYMSTGMLQQQQAYQDYYRNLGLSLAGRQTLSTPTMPTTGQYAQNYNPQDVMGYNATNYGNYAGLYGSMYGANAQMAGSQNDMWGNIIGGGLGAAGSIGAAAAMPASVMAI